MQTKTVLMAAAVAALCLSVQGCSDPKKSLGIGKRSPDEFTVVTRAPLSLPPEFALRPPQPGSQRPQELNPVDAARTSVFGSTGAQAGGSQAGSTAVPPGAAPARSQGGAPPSAPPIGPAVDAAPRTPVATASLNAAPPTAPRPGQAQFAARGPSAAPAGPTPGEAALMSRAGTTGSTPNIRAIVDEETSKFAQADKQLIDTLIFWKDPPPAHSDVVNPVAETQRLQENAALGKPVNEGDVPIIKRKTPSLFQRLF